MSQESVYLNEYMDICQRLIENGIYQSDNGKYDHRC